MSRVLLIPVASPLHDPELVKKVLDMYYKRLEKAVDLTLPLITDYREIDSHDITGDALAIVAPLTGGTEHLIQLIHEKANYILLLPHASMNSLPSALEAFSKIRDSMKAWIITDWQVSKKVNKFVKAWRVVNELKKMKIGLIGEPSPWLVHSSGVKVREVLGNLFEGLTFLDISLTDLYEEYDRLIRERDDRLSSLSRKISYMAKNVRVSEDAIYSSLVTYLALKHVIEKFNLDAVTVRCFDITKDLNTTSCLAVSLINSKNAIIGCEGDLPALITMIIASKLADAPSVMGNLVWIKRNILMLAHCTIPLSMVRRFDLDSHYESGKGVGIVGYLPRGRRITLARLDPVYNVIRYAVGKILSSGSIQSNLCRTQVKMKIYAKLDKCNQFIEEAIGNHYVVTLKDITEELKYLSKIIGVRLEEV